MKLEESHTTIITNCNLLSRKISSKNDAERECKRKRKRAQENSRKSVTRKAKREFARACDVTKIITSGRIKYESLENGTEKISQVKLCAEPIKQLKPRYHMTALKTLIAKNYFEDDAVEQINETVTSLEKQKQVTSQKKAKNNSCGKKQCTLDFFVKKSLEISSPQSDSPGISSESDSEDG